MGPFEGKLGNINKNLWIEMFTLWPDIMGTGSTGWIVTSESWLVWSKKSKKIKISIYINPKMSLLYAQDNSTPWFAESN